MLDADQKERLLATSTTLQSAVAQEFSVIAEDVRWFATLAVAGMAALAGYRELEGQNSLSAGFALIVVLLCLSLLFFLASVLSSQLKRRGVTNELISFTSLIQDLDADRQKLPDVGLKEARDAVEPLRKRVLQAARGPRSFELWGVGLLIVAVALAAPLVLFTEISKAIFS